MAPHVGFSQLLLVALGLLCLLIHVGWPHAPSIAPETSPTPNTRRRKRATASDPCLALSSNRCATRVSKRSMLVPRHPARPPRLIDTRGHCRHAAAVLSGSR